MSRCRLWVYIGFMEWIWFREALFSICSVGVLWSMLPDGWKSDLINNVKYSFSLIQTSDVTMAFRGIWLLSNTLTIKSLPLGL